FLPQHDGKIGVPKIVPFAGASVRDGEPATPAQIDSFRNNPASYTGGVDGIVIPHDQPNAYKVQGAIVASTLGVGGTGYAANDTGTINTGDGLATYQVLTVTAGVVATYQLVNRGSNYIVANGVATSPGGAQPGVGTGFTINILTVGQTGTGQQSPI